MTNTVPAKEYWYRYVDKLQTGSGLSYGSSDYFINKPSVGIELEKYEVIRKTPKGVYLRINEYRYFANGKTERWVGLAVQKRFAHPTLQEAQQSFLRRKKAQHLLYEDKSIIAREAYVKAADMFNLPIEIQSAATLFSVYGSEMHDIY